MSLKKIKKVIARQWEIEQHKYQNEPETIKNIKSVKRTSRFFLKKIFKKIYLKLEYLPVTITVEGEYFDQGANQNKNNSNQKKFDLLAEGTNDMVRRIAAIEPQIGFEYLTNIFPPTTFAINGNQFVQCFKEVIEEVGTHPDYIFLMPHLVIGGAEWVAISHINLLMAKGHKVLVLVTQKADNTKAIDWFTKQPTIVYLDKYLDVLPNDQYVDLLLKVCIQLNPQTIHNVNSLQGWQMISKAGKQISAVCKVVVSVFCYAYSDTDKNLRVGYIERYLKNTIDHISLVLTDNQHIIDCIESDFGLSKSTISKFKALYYPPRLIKDIEKKYLNTEVTDEVKILWAGRISYHKRLDILLEVAKLNPAYTFFVYGYTQDTLSFFDELRQTPNIKMMGSYTNYKDLLIEEYHAFLYTSSFDGLPNVLIETVLSGLPIVASNAGGVSELVNQNTGVLVEEIDNTKAYSDGLREIVGNREQAKIKANNAYKLLRKRHTIEEISKTLIKIEYM
tara:strand:- start:1139 stop:2653 length:1515 start_codon:yes stop_codon:yes gene_type:complete